MTGEPADLSPLIRLLRSAASGSLATAMRHAGDNPDKRGAPYVSLVTIATDQQGQPVFLFSQLADHTQNLIRDNRASLLIEGASRRANPQTGPRVTLMGRVENSADQGEARAEADGARFLARHPKARMYAGFGDFGFYRMVVERAHWVGGFGRARWFSADQFLTGTDLAEDFARAEPGVLAHMNADHADALDLYANRLLKRKGTGWQMAGIDPDGLDLVRGGSRARLDFTNRLPSSDSIRSHLVELVKQARS
ncbi:MAG: HugZ family protein [Magnetovibrionaceae bacterium]